LRAIHKYVLICVPVLFVSCVLFRERIGSCCPGKGKGVTVRK
jgi:hypothetical protein